METEVALDLFLHFLEKRGVKEINLCKELNGLVAFGEKQGFFKDPGSLFHEQQWQEYGVCLWNLVIDDNKEARKLMKPWRAVNNCLKQYHVEK